jgi:hypothetical protein
MLSFIDVTAWFPALRGATRRFGRDDTLMFRGLEQTRIAL